MGFWILMRLKGDRIIIEIIKLNPEMSSRSELGFDAVNGELSFWGETLVTLEKIWLL